MILRNPIASLVRNVLLIYEKRIFGWEPCKSNTRTALGNNPGDVGQENSD